MLVVGLHQRLKNFVVKFKTKGSVLNRQKKKIWDTKNAPLSKMWKLSGYQSLKTIRKVSGKTLRH